MSIEKQYPLGENGELGQFSEEEIKESVTKLGGESPEEIEAGFDAAGENRLILKNVRESAGGLLDTLINAPKSIDMLADAYVDSLVKLQTDMGRKKDEEGTRMMLGAAIKAIGKARAVTGTDELVKKIAGSVEAVNEWYAKYLSKPPEGKQLQYSEADIDEWLAQLDGDARKAEAAGSVEAKSV